MQDNYEITGKPKSGCTYQPNAILRDPNLTSDAKTVIYFLLSLTKGFNLTNRSIAKTIHLSEPRVKRAIELLQKTGYLSIQKVRNGKLYSGYHWLISGFPNTYRKYTDELSINETSIDGISIHELSKDETSISAPTYELPIGELPINEKTNRELPIGESSSSPTPSPKQLQPIAGQEEAEVLSQKEFMYQQFLKKYPKKPTGTDAAATKKAFFEIPDLEHTFVDIMAGLDEWCNSVDWNKEGGRYITKPLNFITTQKWEEVPRGIKTEIDPGMLKIWQAFSDTEAFI